MRTAGIVTWAFLLTAAVASAALVTDAWPLTQTDWNAGGGVQDQYGNSYTYIASPRLALVA